MSTKVSAAIGEVVTWNMRRVFVPASDVQQVLDDLKINLRVKRTRPATFLRRAIEQSIQDGTVRKIAETAHHVAYAVVEEQTSMNDLNYETHLLEAIRLNKADQTLTFKRNNAFTRQIREAVQRNEGGLLSHELGQVLKHIVCGVCAGVPLRDTGGAYFVPSKYLPLLAKTEEALQRVCKGKGHVAVNRFPVVMNARAAADLASLYNEAVMRDVMEVRDEVAGYVKDIVRARPATFVARIGELKARLVQLDVYKQTLTAMNFDDTAREVTVLISLLERCRVQCVKARALRRSKKTK